MRINQNIAALNTYRQLSANNVNTGKSLEKLSSGLRINRAGDDAAGLAISEKMRAQVRGLDQASRNSQDAISLIQTAEGALNETQSILQRMRELAVQSANDTNVTEDRAAIQSEINQLTSEINRIGNTTEFNTQKLLNGDKYNSFTVTGASFSGGAPTQALVGGTGTLLTGGSALDSGSYKLVVTKSVASGHWTSGGTVVTVSGLNDQGTALDPIASDVTYAGTSGKPVFSGSSILLDSGSGNLVNDSSGVSGSFDLAIWRSGNDLVISGTNSFGLTSQDLLVADSTGSGFLYNDHGISFKITSISGWESGTSNAITYAKAADEALDGDLGTQQDYWSALNVAGSGTKTTADAAVSNITLASGIAGGTYTITFGTNATDDDSGFITVSGTGSGTIIDDRISGIITGSTFTYNNAGITFTVSLSGFGSGGSGKISFDVVKEQTTDSGVSGTTYQTTFTAQLQSASGVAIGSGVVIGTSASGSGADAAAGSGQTIQSAFSGTVGGGLQLSYASGASVNAGSGSFTVTRTTSGTDNSLTFQIGANQNQSMSLSISDMRAAELGVSASSTASGFKATMEVTNGTSATVSEYALDVTTTSGAANAVTVINDAINRVSEERSKLGAVQNRLEHTINNLGTSSENLTAAESRIRDVDMARQMMEFTKNNILTQAAQSMLAQANQQPQGVLQLLR